MAGMFWGPERLGGRGQGAQWSHSQHWCLGEGNLGEGMGEKD